MQRVKLFHCHEGNNITIFFITKLLHTTNSPLAAKIDIKTPPATETGTHLLSAFWVHLPRHMVFQKSKKCLDINRYEK